MGVSGALNSGSPFNGTGSKRRGFSDAQKGAYIFSVQHNISLPGHGVRLVPLRRRHAADLYPYIDADMWAGMASERPTSKRALERLFAARIADPSVIAFAVIDEETGTVAGTTSLYDYVPEQSRVELGMTFFGRNYWGRNVNASSKLALLAFAFEELLVHRVTLRCDVRNVRSAAAIVKLGATLEGVLRGYRRGHDGTRVDIQRVFAAGTRVAGIPLRPGPAPHPGRPAAAR